MQLSGSAPSILMYTLCCTSNSMIPSKPQGLPLHFYHAHIKQHTLVSASCKTTCSLTRYYHVTLTKVHTDRLSTSTCNIKITKFPWIYAPLPLSECKLKKTMMYLYSHLIHVACKQYKFHTQNLPIFDTKVKEISLYEGDKVYNM